MRKNTRNVKPKAEVSEHPEKHGQPWTVEDMWQLVELYAQEEPRLTWRSIAEGCKRTVPACEFRIAVIRLAYHIFSDMNPEKLMAKLAGGFKRHKKA